MRQGLVDEKIDYFYDRLFERANDDLRLAALMSIETAEFLVGQLYYFFRNLGVRSYGYFSKKGSREDHITGLPWIIYHLGKENFVDGGKKD